MGQAMDVAVTAKSAHMVRRMASLTKSMAVCDTSGMNLSMLRNSEREREKKMKRIKGREKKARGEPEPHNQILAWYTIGKLLRQKKSSRCIG